MESNNSVLVIGGGIAGIQASLDLADRGLKVYLVEKTPSIGGRMAQLDKTFPTMDCSICILAPKMIECLRHPNITLLTYCDVQDVSGSAGNFTVNVLKNPRFINEEKCTGCGECSQNCPIEIPNEFDMGLGVRKAIYVPFLQAVPLKYTIDEQNCIKCRLCQRTCKAEAVNFDQKPQTINIKVGAIVVATGFDMFDAQRIREYGYGRFKDVLLSLEFERLVSASGPTGGHILRLSDGRIPRRIAFIQCVGSRSRKGGVTFCSSACCVYATKEAILIREHDPECEVYIFYNELKVFGKGFQEFVNRARDEWGVKYVRALPGEVVEDPKTHDLTVWYEDTTENVTKNMKVDIVILCPALLPKVTNKDLAGVLGLALDEYGFFECKDTLFSPVDTNVPGIFICGYSQGPKDIPESVAQASGAAARAAEVMALAASREAQ